MTTIGINERFFGPLEASLRHLRSTSSRLEARNLKRSAPSAEHSLGDVIAINKNLLET